MTPPTPSVPASRNYWPYAIIAFFVLFIGWTIGFIVFSTFHRVDLVSPDYYQQELRYQEQMDREARTRGHEGEMQIALTPDRPAIRLSLPRRATPSPATGMVHLYRPSTAGLDQRLPLVLDAEGRQEIDTRSLARGLWRVQITWSEGGETFYQSQEVVIGLRDKPIPASDAPHPVRD